MPVNEILAPIYIKGKYATPAYPDAHAFRLYFRTGSSWSPGATGDEDNWRVNYDGDVVGSVAGIVSDLFTRSGAMLPDNTSITELALWHSIPDADNVLDHYNTLPIGNSYGSGAGIASAYAMLVFGSALQAQFRWTFFDGNNASPQKYPPYTPTTEDDDTLEWFFIKAGYGLATQDGILITRERSQNTGYNRKLARAYGRTITP